MTNTLASIKSRVRELRSYSLRTDPARVKLNQNESPWDAPARIKQETLRRISDCAWSRLSSADGRPRASLQVTDPTN